MIRLSGVGSRDVATGAMDALGGALDRSRPGKPVAAIVDMTRAVGCTPACSRRCLRFVRERGARVSYAATRVENGRGRYGGALGRVAVVGRGFSLAYVRLILRVTPFRGIRVFGDADAAARWLADGD